ncbi:GMP synthase [Gregarina niphandrodes]|uniref:GMP synthase [glutamine-hydrolyzing] n=1 Tax=Gregarina niphandrodes TaxID=110365 RepID=A0A023AZS3_GRENI|nr:GMP synthase [Gregarina niphandrodes]EZG44392.1 GMP synthase [Gregarina niphandrodes]|eukprot:XP_011132670.1 GMP synthase [Gregarina niphandrodes]
MLDDKVAVLDFGSQYTQLIVRRVREVGVYCEVFGHDVSEDVLRGFGPKSIILTGSPRSTMEESPLKPGEFIWSFGVPILGVCYGMQVMAMCLGGRTGKSEKSEFGYSELSLDVETGQADGGLFKDFPVTSRVWMSHGDEVSQLPAGFSKLAHSQNCCYGAMANVERQLFAVQHHPEVTETATGGVLFENFLLGICGLRATWTPARISQQMIDKAAEELKEGGDVLLGLSGGVDSSVVAVILHRAIGPRLKCVMIDHGLMRSDESKNVVEAFRAASEAGSGMLPEVHVVDAREQFFSALKGVTDPEAKRRIIGREFVEAFDREVVTKYPNVKYLAQGTIYPDVIESAKVGNAALIKTHHNVGGLPEKMKLKLVEPIRMLFKDEVRRVGEILGLPHDFVWRHPFPGPGLAVRILGEVTPERADKLRKADDIFIKELFRAGCYHNISQALAALIPSKAVGVKGDERVYEEMISLRAIHTTDFMTATVVDLPHQLLVNVVRRITNEVPGISRVLYDYTDKPPATIEYE